MYGKHAAPRGLMLVAFGYYKHGAPPELTPEMCRGCHPVFRASSNSSNVFASRPEISAATSLTVRLLS